MDNSPVNLFKGTIDTLTRAMDLRARKHETILNNVANADTPNFKPFAMNVEEALQHRSQSPPAASLVRTNERHLPSVSTVDENLSKQPSPQGDDALKFRGDGNTVDIDAEMTALAKNSLLYKASAQMVASKFSGLKNVITGGNK